jgi:ATP-dependent Zn protease
MNTIGTIRSIVLVLCLGIGINFQAKNNLTTQQKPLSVQQASAITKSLNKSAQCIQQIDEIIGHLAMLINNRHIKDLPNIDKTKQTLYVYRQILGNILHALQEDLPLEAQIRLTVALLQISDEFILLLDTGLKSNLKQLKEFNPQSLTRKRSPITDLSPKKLDEMITATQKKIQNLKIKANSAGLTWYNIAARSVDKHIVSRWNKYHMTPIVKTVGSAALFSTYALWQYGKFSDPIRETNTYKTLVVENKFTGETPIITQSGPQEIIGSTLKPMHDIKPLALLDYMVRQSYTDPLAHLCGAAVIAQYTGIWSESISPWLNKKIDDTWNFLRGGSYLDIQQPGVLSFEPESDFDDMIGLDEVKQELSTILDYLTNPEASARSGITPETGWIMTGPTRTGKTFSFECLCGEIKKLQKSKGGQEYKFIRVEIDDLNEAGIKRILAFAKYYAPMVLFIDEIDLLSLNRAQNSERLMAFLTALEQATKSKSDPLKNIIIITATNCPETLDKALRQNGRLGKEIRFEYPTFKYRKIFLMKELAKMALDPRNFDIDTLTAKTNDKSYEDLKAIIRSAMMTSWSMGIPLTQELLETSINKEIKKIISIDRKELPETEQRILATHYAGKALAMTFLETRAKLDIVTTKAIMTELVEKSAWHVMSDKIHDKAQEKIIHGGIFTKMFQDTIQLKTTMQLTNEVKIMIAGFVAEEILLGGCNMQCNAQDYTKAHTTLDQLMFEGLYPSQLSKTKCNELHDKAYNLLQQYRQETKQLFEEHHEALVALTEELMKKGIMTDKEVQAVIDKIENPIIEETIPTEEITAPTEDTEVTAQA